MTNNLYGYDMTHKYYEVNMQYLKGENFPATYAVHLTLSYNVLSLANTHCIR